MQAHPAATVLAVRIPFLGMPRLRKPTLLS